MGQVEMKVVDFALAIELLAAVIDARNEQGIRIDEDAEMIADACVKLVTAFAARAKVDEHEVWAALLALGYAKQYPWRDWWTGRRELLT